MREAKEAVEKSDVAQRLLLALPSHMEETEQGQMHRYWCDLPTFGEVIASAGLTAEEGEEAVKFLSGWELLRWGFSGNPHIRKKQEIRQLRYGRNWRGQQVALLLAEQR